MPRVERTPKAHEDAVAIWEYISQDNPVTASKLIASIEELAQRLAAMPESAESVSMIGRHIRQAPLRNYVIYFRPITDGIEVLRILHGARQPKDLL